MSQASLLLQALKQELRLQDKTYQDVAMHIGLSQASVKRLFSQQDLSLQRLDKICQLLGLELSDLLAKLQQQLQQRQQLEHTQEQALADDTLLFLVAVSVISGFSFSDILAHYQVDRLQLVQKMAQLDRLGLIELKANNEFRLLISNDFHWLKNGPIEQLFHQKIKQDFFQSNFAEQTESLQLISGLLSESNNLELQKQMQSLIKRFAKLSQADKNTSMQHKHGTTMVLALRQWRYSEFAKYQTQ